MINKFFKDPSGYIFFIFDNFLIRIRKNISSIYMRYIMLIRGIKYDKNNIFYGVTYFRRYQNSSITIGKNCRLRSFFLSNNVGLNRRCFISTLKSNAKILIGNNVGLSGTVIGCAESITIGDNVLLGGNTFITDTDWHPLKKDKNTKTVSKPVIIEDDAFIGLNSIILKGSHIGKGSVIGANSVVSGYIPDRVIAAGNPCKIIKSIE